MQKLELKVTDQTERIYRELSVKLEESERRHTQEMEELRREHKNAVEILGREIGKKDASIKQIVGERDASMQRELQLTANVEKVKKSLKTQKDSYERKLDDE